MEPLQVRNEPLMYKLAMLSGKFPNVEPSLHDTMIKQAELRHKLNDFSLIRKNRIESDIQVSAKADRDRNISIMNSRLPHLRGMEAQAQARHNFQRDFDDRVSVNSGDL